MPTGFFIYDFVEAESPEKCFSEGVWAGSRRDRPTVGRRGWGWSGAFFLPKKGGGVAHAGDPERFHRNRWKQFILFPLTPPYRFTFYPHV